MNGLLLVAIGGAIGASSRYLVAIASGKAFGDWFPFGTLLINIVGCFLMGVFVEYLAARLQPSEGLRLFVATGFLGGFTTFSAFSLDFVSLWQRGDAALAIGYGAASIILSLAGIVLGLWLGRAIF
jgi:CrcB protein